LRNNNNKIRDPFNKILKLFQHKSNESNVSKTKTIGTITGATKVQYLDDNAYESGEIRWVRSALQVAGGRKLSPEMRRSFLHVIVTLTVRCEDRLGGIFTWRDTLGGKGTLGTWISIIDDINPWFHELHFSYINWFSFNSK